MGQTEAEFAVVVAGIGIACIAVVLFFGGAVSGLWDRSTTPVTPNTFNPPTNTTEFAEPKTAQDCENEGYKRYTDLGFDTEQECLDYVAGPNP